MLQLITLPEQGESVLEVNILNIHVLVGQKIATGEPLLEFATDKVDTEFPSDVDGTVVEIFVKKGQVVPIGAKLLSIEMEAMAETAVEKNQASPVVAVPVSPTETELWKQKKTAALIAQTFTNTEGSAKKISPVAKKVAKAFDLDLGEVMGSVLEERRITKKDVDNFIKKRLQTAPNAVPFTPKPLEDFSKFGKIEFEDLNPIDKATARHLAQVWATVPHAWMMEKADITKLHRHRLEAKTQLTNLSWTALYIKTVVGVLKQFPRCNASFDATVERIVFKKYYHIGVAVDTPKGLVVAVVYDADRKSLMEIAADLEGFSKKAKSEGKGFTSVDFEGHSFTVSNVGMFGSTGILPIVHAPDSAILGLTAAKKEIVWDEITQQPVARLLLPMTLGFDHRIVNGAEASQFLALLRERLEGPVLGLF